MSSYCQKLRAQARASRRLGQQAQGAGAARTISLETDHQIFDMVYAKMRYVRDSLPYLSSYSLPYFSWPSSLQVHTAVVQSRHSCDL
jgi:hypothetical protein